MDCSNLFGVIKHCDFGEMANVFSQLTEMKQVNIEYVREAEDSFLIVFTYGDINYCGIHCYDIDTELDTCSYIIETRIGNKDLYWDLNNLRDYIVELK